MIQFPCRCGHAFSLPDDQAGGLIQCPRCSLLVDIPTHDDLLNLNSDGTYALEAAEEPADPMTAADLHRVFSTHTTDGQGRQKDLRSTASRVATVGISDEQPARVAPRYDPESGELIRPLQFKDEQPLPVLSLAVEVDPATVQSLDAAIVPTPVIPISAPPAKPPSLGYAVGITRRGVSMKSLAIELLMPANVAVMFFIYLCCIAGYFTTIGLATYTERFLVTVRPFLLLNLPMWIVLSHLGCTLEDTGPEAIDELPRPLRNFSLGEDFLTPLLRTLLAIAICFLPFSLLFHRLDPANPLTLPINFIFALAGVFLFPAVLLTTVTGTTVLNLRPDRLAAVIRICGLQYFASIALFILAAAPTVYYLGNELLFPGQRDAPFFDSIEHPYILLPALAAAVYLLHFFGWHLGMMYRAGHDEFPWLAQRHERVRKFE
jgi:hypothetical protein